MERTSPHFTPLTCHFYNHQVHLEVCYQDIKIQHANDRRNSFCVKEVSAALTMGSVKFKMPNAYSVLLRAVHSFAIDLVALYKPSSLEEAAVERCKIVGVRGPSSWQSLVT
uniref:Uncharacterized protein n=1 Tax=Coccidioides posadasii RMSCC 3488 TaxID=454284 RepID=A0A0J6F371_COCPO|nr:hypothetical protein CPAG_00049 [Coccidioides posadasii RMSCC 3488]